MLGPLRGGGIRRRLLMWGLSLFGIALFFGVVAGYSYMAREMRRDAAALQSEIASVTGEQIRNFVRRKVERFSDNADALSLYQLGSKEQRLLLGLLVKNDSSFTDASIINSQGMEVVKVSDRKVYFPSDLTDQSKSPKFITALGGEDYVSPVYTSDKAQPYITVAIPFWGAAQSIVGVVSAEADLSFLWEVIGKIHFATAGYAYLIDEHGSLIAHSDATLVLKRPDLRQVAGVQRFLRNPAHSDSTPAQEGRGLLDKPVLSTYAPVPELGWSVILEEPIDAALANVEILKRSALVFLVVGLFVGAAIIAWVSQKITRPIQELRQDVATIGAGNLEHRADIRTGDEIEELAAEFNKMTDALQNSYATLEQKVDQRTKEISALYSVTTAVNESLALKDILNAVIPKTTEIFRFETIRVFLFNDDGDELELRASFAIDPEYATAIRALKRGQGVIGCVAETAKPMIFEDIRTDARYTKLSSTKATLNANLGFLAVFPIKTQARVFGVILFGARSPRKLSDDETRLLTSMSEHLAVAVEKANLFRESETRAQQLSVQSEALRAANLRLQETNAELMKEISERQRAENEVLRQNQRIQALYEIESAIVSTLDRERLLETLFDKIGSLLSYSAITVRLLNKETQQLEPVASRNLDQGLWKKEFELYKNMSGRGLSKAVFEKRAPVVVENVQTDPRTGNPEFFRKQGLVSYIGIPLVAEGQILGVLGFYMREKHWFAKEEGEFLSALGREVAIAIHNSQLYEQIKNQAAALELANKGKDEFMNMMSHELRTPLNVIMGYAQVLSEGVFGKISDQQATGLQKIIFHSKELFRLVSDILQVGRIEAGRVRGKFEDVNINDLLAELRSSYDIPAKKNFTLQWSVAPALPVVKTDAERLKHVLQNLINNAVKFTETGSVTVSARFVSDTIEFKVKDTGIGIEQEKLPTIFEMFRQVDSSDTRSYGGVGVGLYIVKKFTELLKGTIEVESLPGQGSTFTLVLPLDVAKGSVESERQELAAPPGA